MAAPKRIDRSHREKEIKRLHNLKTYWEQRYAACQNDFAKMASTSFDRARAAARRAERQGNDHALYELAQLVAAFAERLETAELDRHTP